MILTFMRHPPIDAGSERCIGQTDAELSPEGRTALPLLAEEACRLKADKILCSDLQRCQLLAEAIAARLGLLAEPDPVWRELSFGTWENRTWSDIRAREPHVFSEWITNFDTVAPPDGESFEKLQARVLTGVKDKIVGPKCDTGIPPEPQARANAGETPALHYLVVTHAGVIRAAVSAFFRLPLRNAFELAVPYGSHTSFCWDGNHWSLDRKNRSACIADKSLKIGERCRLVDLVAEGRTLSRERAL
jgi:broad specificity phosphatase PhoE